MSMRQRQSAGGREGEKYRPSSLVGGCGGLSWER